MDEIRKAAADIAGTVTTAAQGAADIARMPLGDIIEHLKGQVPEGMDVVIVDKSDKSDKAEAPAAAAPKARRRKPKAAADAPAPEPEAASPATNGAAPQMSDKDAHDAALSTLFNEFSKGGEQETAVRQVLADFGVARFQEVPIEKGHDLLARAQQIAT